MQIEITGRHVDLTDSLREYVENKMQRIERHFDIITGAHVILAVENEKQNSIHKAEATLELKGARVFADCVDDTMYAAIDGLTDKLDRQVKKHKEKMTDHHRSDGGLKTQEV